MCGICGIYRFDGKPQSRDEVGRMCRAMRHRGPDGEGVVLAPPVGFGHRRLSIIDVADGSQPMGNEDGTIQIVFNGEMYNFREVRERHQGHTYRTRSDTEVIIHEYEEKGERCVDAFNGMFAFAIIDQRPEERPLFIARDRLGIKPLYYFRDDARLIFASEIKAILECAGVPLEPCVEALDLLMTYGYVPAPLTPFENIWKLPAGHWLRCTKDGSVEVQSYWDVSYQPKYDGGPSALADEMIELLGRAVERQMVSDVPLGALLSGGIDSALVVSLMSRATSEPVKTFTIGFAERSHDERPLARLTAEHLGTDHAEQVIKPDIEHILPMLVWHTDEPLGDASIMPTYLVSQMARQEVTVALSGSGGDELFAGYDHYWHIPRSRHYQSAPAMVRSGVRAICGVLPVSASGRGLLCKARRFVQVADLPARLRHIEVMAIADRRMKERLYAPELLDQTRTINSPWPYEMQFAGVPANTDLDALLHADMRTVMVDDFLLKEDKMSMASSLELRVPLLDHEIVEFAARIPENMKLRGFTTKYLLRLCARKLLPPEISRAPKHGFGLPFGSWARAELKTYVEDIILSQRALDRGHFRAEGIRELFQAHCARRADHRTVRLLFCLLTLELWHRIFIDGEGVDSAAPHGAW